MVADVADMEAPDRRESEQRHIAFVAALFRRHNQSLRGYLANLAPAREEAEDLLQEAYLRLLQRSQLEQDGPRARNYLFKTAANLVHDSNRRRISRSERSHVALDAIEMAADGPGPEQLVDRDRELGIVRRALQDSQPRARTAFLLHLHEQMTYGQIAALLGVCRKTIERDVVATLHLCRSRLEVRPDGSGRPR